MSPVADLNSIAQQSRIDIIREIGFMGYKFLITLNAGAFVVLLTFIGNVPQTSYFAIDLEKLKLAMLLFLGAITMTFISMTIAYVSAQFSLLDRSMPGGSSSFGHMLWLILPVIASFMLFLFGGLQSISAIHEF